MISEKMELITNFPSYSITKDGKILSKNVHRFLKHYNTKQGYQTIMLIGKDKIRKSFRIHRLVAQAFILNPNNHKTVREHIYQLVSFHFRCCFLQSQKYPPKITP